MNDLIRDAYKRLLRAIFGEFDDDDLLPIRECDVVKIDEILESFSDQGKGRLGEIIRLRFGLRDGQGFALSAIARLYNITNERIRQQEGKALNLLRQPKNRLAFRKLFRSFLESRSDSWEEYDPSWHKWRIEQLEKQLAGRIRINEILLEMSGIKEIKIDTLELSVRADRCLKEVGILTLSDLLKKTQKDLMSINGISRKTVNEIQYILDELGLELKTES